MAEASGGASLSSDGSVESADSVSSRGAVDGTDTGCDVDDSAGRKEVASDVPS